MASRGYTGADLTDVTVHPSNPAIVYVNGRSGPFMSPDAGVTWHGVNPINVRPISEGARVVVDPHNPSHVLMSDKEGATYESMDGGMQWTLVTNFSDEEFQGMQAITFAPSTPGKVYGGFGVYPCATDAIEWSCNTPTSVSILTSEDGGRTWTHHEGTALDGLTVTEIVVHPLNADTAWAATVGGGVFRTSDGGVTWEPASNGLIDKRVMNLAGDPNNPGVLYAGTAGGGVFKSENGGASWRASSVGMAPNEPIGAIVVDPVRPNVVYAGSWSSGVFISDDAGATWRKLNDGLRTRSVRALAISSGGEVLYAGTRGEGVFKLALASIEAVKMPPIIDTHVHIWPTTEAENQQYIDQLVDAMVRSNVKKVALGLNARHISQRPPTYSPEHDQFVLAAYQRHPSRIIPMLAGFDPQDESAVDYVKTQLETGPWQGIGELDLRNEPKQTTNPADHPVMMQIYQLAAQYHVPVLIHFDPCYGISCTGGMEEIRRALRANPETIFIWAHGCPLDLMTAYSNLYCEHESPGESLPHEFPDRTLLGTDIQDPNLRNNLPDHSVISYEETIDRLRQELSRLNPQDAEKVAYKNAQHLFHLTASP
ncbi:MAG TPA: hypothetical protein ENI60_00955 [Candidatus Fraserbacteria bacterium]|nr:hypothetical protein [Candidatus Fraserbacteria bacterium]